MPVQHPVRDLSGRLNRSVGRGPAGFTAIVLLVIALIVWTSNPIADSTAGQSAHIVQGLILTFSALAIGFSLRERSHTSMLIMWVFVYTLIGIVQTVQLSRGRNPFGVPFDNNHIFTQQMLVLSGAFVAHFVFVYSSGSLRPSARRLVTRPISLQKTVWLGVIAMIVVPVIVVRFGGPVAFFGSGFALADGYSGTSTELTLLLSIASILSFAPLFCLLHLRLAGQFTFSKRFELLILFIVLIALNVVVNNPITQARYWIATIGIAFLLSSRRVTSAWGQATLTLVLVASACLIFPYLDLFRTAGLGDATISNRGIVEQYLYKTDYGSAQDIVNVIALTEVNGVTNGRQLLGVVFFFVPRDLWVDKPSNSSELIANFINYPNPNLDTPLWAEGFINFGWLGALGFMALFGLAAARLEASWQPSLRVATVASVLAPVLIGYELIILRGSLLQAMFKLTVILIVVFAISKPSGERGSNPPMALRRE